MKPTRTRLALEQLESRQLLAAVNISGGLSGQVGAMVSAPVSIDNAIGVRAATIRINFDPAVLTLTPENVTAGSAWTSATDTQITTNVNQTTGSVVVFLSASSDLPATGGSLVQFGFTIRAGANVGTVSDIDLAEVRLNEGAIPVVPASIVGADSTDGSITVSAETTDGTAQITGFVYADSNQDSLVSPFEGISGAIVRLVNLSTGATEQTTTAPDGSYRFANLAAGNFQIEQTQPKAFLDGGQNQLAAVLSTNQILTGQNFREIGLLPAWISNRLLTTLAMPVGSTNWQNSLSQITQRAELSPPLNSLAIASTMSDFLSSDSSVNPVQGTESMSLLPFSQGEGEAGQRINPSRQAASLANQSVPQVTKRTKAKGNAELIDNAMASISYFE